MPDCVVCHKIRLWKNGQNPYVVHEFEHSLLMVGDHQFFEGYCQLILKDHVREMHDLPETIQQKVFQELMKAGKTVMDTFRPWKMNYSCYGNAVPHIHWHIFPRYETDPDRLLPPFMKSAEFASRNIDSAEAARVAERIRMKL